MRRERTGEGGFTLVELLVAVAILSIIITSIYFLFSQSARVLDSARARSDLYQEARVLLEKMASDLSNAYFLPGEGRLYFVGLDEAQDGTPRDRLEFTALAYRWPAPGEKADELAEVSYFIEGPPEAPEPRLLRRDVRILDGLPETPEGEDDAQLMSEMVRGLELEFWDEGERKVSEWDTRRAMGGETPRLPKAVKVSLIFEGSRGEQKFSMTIPIPSGMVWSSRPAQGP